MYPNLDSFRCIDCWIPRTLKKVVRKRKRSSSSSSSSNVDWDSSSLDMPRVETEGNPKSIEDKVKDAKSNAEMKVANAAKVREEALKKAAMARKAAQKAANALDVAVAANGEVQGDGSCCPVVDDAELALRLHRAINSSPRIFRNMRSVKLENLVDPKEVKLNASSLSRQSDPEKRVLNGELKVCTGNIGKAASGRKSSESVSDIGPVKKSDHADCNIENPTKEEQASCSSKVAISSENGNSTDSGSQSCQKQEGSKLNSRETPCQSVYDKDSSEQEGKSPHGPDICLKTYSRRHKISKCILDQKNNLLPRNCHLESQTSGTALPLTQMEAELTFNDTSLDSHCVPSRASTPASSLA
ncbi:hypothetical protein IFM89_018362 [Coptis chinensis]|uniref:Uncharacterized protein n=1 Tax=Coptis chinensis TaxID=261450 RepID=A0A835LQL1_9MAGN|nr:hypothetical protein IFM89_018362 [Coptis chinensis]